MLAWSIAVFVDIELFGHNCKFSYCLFDHLQSNPEALTITRYILHVMCLIKHHDGVWDIIAVDAEAIAVQQIVVGHEDDVSSVSHFLLSG